MKLLTPNISKIQILLAGVITTGSPLFGQTVFLDTDFETSTVGNQPTMPFGVNYSPSSNTATNGFTVVDGNSVSANPMDTGKALYAYDFDGDIFDGLSTGTPSHMRFNFATENTDNVRVDFDFQRMYEVTLIPGGVDPELDADTDTRMNIGVVPMGLETNSSANRPFEIRIHNNGTIGVNYNPSGVDVEGRESFVVATYLTTGTNHMTFLCNGNNIDSMPYNDPYLGDGSVSPNSMVLFLNGAFVGEYGFVNRRSSSPPTVAYFDTIEEFGRLGIYQDTKRQGGIVFDNLVIREFAYIAPPAAPTMLTATATSSATIALEWSDNSDNETGFVVEILADSSWGELETVDANSTSYEVIGLEPLTQYSFRIRSTNGTMSEPSNEASATTDALLLPVIEVDPVGELISEDSTATLTVSAVGPETLTYQWYIGDSGDTSNPIAGATSASYTTPELSTTTNYWVRVSNIYGSDDSTTATIEVYQPRVFRIVTLQQLQLLLPDSLPGDTYVIDSGTYNNAHINIVAAGNEDAPITIKAEEPGKVVLTGDSYLRIGGDWIVVEGLLFTNGWNQTLDQAISFRTSSNEQATNCRVTQCAIIDYSPPSSSTDTDWVGMYGTNNRFDHNLLSGHSNIGVTLVVWREPGKVDNHRIDHNHFRKRANGGGENGWETIRIGSSGDSQSASRSIVEYNLFEACDGEVEIISNKSNENIYRYNTFWKSKGMLTLRHGDDCIVEGNIFLGEHVDDTGGIRVIGENHTIINNYIEGTMGRQEGAIAVYAGVENSPLNEYFSAHNAYIANNTILDVEKAYVLVGAGFGTSNRTELPTGVQVVNNLFGQVRTTGALTDGPSIDGETLVNPTYEGNIASGVQLGIDISGTSLETIPFSVGEYGLLRPDAGSGIVDASVNSMLTLDMDGQARDMSPDVGADEVSDANGLNIGGPLRPLETGPDWREDVDLSPPWKFPGKKSGEWIDSSWMGLFYIANDDWIYHPDHGWLFIKFIHFNNNLWMFSPSLQTWIWSTNEAFPFVYDDSRGQWIYYLTNDGSLRVYTYQTDSWVLTPN